MQPQRLLPLFLLILLLGCTPEAEPQKETVNPPQPPRESPYANFNSVAALDRALQYEEEYFENYTSGLSVSFGRVWADGAMLDTVPGETESMFDAYKAELAQLGKERDSLDCTLYAQELLRVGLGAAQYAKLDSMHREIWGDREYAGWSVGYLLTEHFGWKAYLMLNTSSVEFDKCSKQYKKDQKYPVWRQPNIQLSGMYVIGEEDAQIDSLIRKEEFGWGFSEQGIHTWVMTEENLKECNWAGAPAWRYDVPGAKPLFITTPFARFYDYNSHVVVYPPKKEGA